MVHLCLEEKLEEQPIESDGGVDMIELLNKRNYELELRTNKLENKVKKLTTLVNKLVKQIKIDD